jgi:phosphoribosyl 1,2-cyclic phosphate phosphodiesterase
MGQSANSGRLTILGCGGSGGVPLIGNVWGDCDPHNPKNRRTRASVHIVFDHGLSLQIDTGPDFRAQCNREDIKHIDAIFYTHAHSDHINGIDDARYMAMVNDCYIQCYGYAPTIQEVEARFKYLFEHTNRLYMPRLISNHWAQEYLNQAQHLSFEDDVNSGREIEFTPIYQTHGETFSIAYRFGDLAYSTDVSDMDDKTISLLKGVKTWIVDCGQIGQDFTEIHPNLDIVLGWQDKVQADQVILTHLPIRADYQKIQNILEKRGLSDTFSPAYDGLKLDFKI